MTEASPDFIAALERRRAALQLLQKTMESPELAKDIEAATAEIERLQAPEILRDRRPATMGHVAREFRDFSKVLAQEIKALRQRISHLEAQNATKEAS